MNKSRVWRRSSSVRYWVVCCAIGWAAADAMTAATAVLPGDEPAATATTAPQVMTTDKSGATTVQLPPSTFAQKVLNGLVIPHWIGRTDTFWYRRETPQGSEFMVVAAASGSSHPAFDSKVVAAGLTNLGMADVKQTALPFTSFEFVDNGAGIAFEVAATHYTCRTTQPSCSVVASVSPALSVSPDGRHAILVRDGNLWLRDSRSGRETALTSDGGVDNGYGIYPDGWKAAYIPRAKSATPLPPLGASWSPDSTRVLVSHTDQRHVLPYPFIEYAPDDGSFRPKVYNVRIPLVGEAPAKFEWYVANVSTGAVVRIAFPYEDLLALQQDLLAIRKTWWTHDGKTLYAAAFGQNMRNAYLFRVDVQTGAVQTIISEAGEPRADLNSTSYDPPNVRIVDDGSAAIWFSQRDGWGHLYLYDGVTGALKTQITRGNWLVRDIVDIDQVRHRIYFTGSGREPGDPYYRYLYSVGLDGSNLKLLTPEPMDHLITGPENDVLTLDGAISYDVLSPSGKFIVYNASTLDHPPEASIRTTDGRLVGVFERADTTALLAAGYQPPQSVRVTAADGSTPLWAVLYSPRNVDTHKRYPIVDTQYGSPLTAVVPHNFMSALSVPVSPQPAALVTEGLAAVVIDARGTTFRSKAFSNAMQGKLDTMNLEDHVAAIRELAHANPWLDTERVGVIGGSYGGWVTFRAMLRFNDFYKVGVAFVPPGGMHSMYLDYHWTAFQGDPLYADGSNLRPTATAFPSNWAGLDSSIEVDRLKGKLLIIMGALDENAIPGSTMQFVNALQKKGKDFGFIYEPEANHYSTPNAYTTGRTIAFLKAGLGGPVGE
jgi:dipeptidyl-peptidase-4